MMAKRPDEIKQDLKNTINSCLIAMTWGDPLSYPQAVFKAHETLINAYNFIKQLEAERDEAVSELVGTCQVCRWEETAKCASCHFNADAWNVHESNWQWRGVQKEE